VRPRWPAVECVVGEGLSSSFIVGAAWSAK
jgi:hypothetical protein